MSIAMAVEAAAETMPRKERCSGGPEYRFYPFGSSGV